MHIHLSSGTHTFFNNNTFVLAADHLIFEEEGEGGYGWLGKEIFFFPKPLVKELFPGIQPCTIFFTALYVIKRI